MDQKTREFREQISKYFIKMLEEKNLEWKKNWNAISNAAVNATTGKKYEGINRFWLSLKAAEMGSDDPRWATFKQIQDKGWQLNKGSKGAKVEYWMPYDFTGKVPLTWEEYGLLRKQPNVAIVSKYYTVFNGRDITGIPTLELPKERQIVTDAIIQKISKNMDVPIYHDGGNKAFYQPITDDIHLPKPGMFLTAYDYDCTALHELSHATGAEKRLHRNIQNQFGDEKYAYEELVAEISSCFMGEHLDIKQTEEHRINHAAYVQAWIQEIKDKPETLIKAIRDAEQAADLLELHAGLISEKEYKEYLHYNGEIPKKETEKLQKLSVEAPLRPFSVDIVESLKVHGYRPTKTILDGIKTLNQITDKEHSLKDLKEAFSNHTYQDRPEAEKVLNKIVQALQRQERVQAMMIPQR